MHSAHDDLSAGLPHSDILTSQLGYQLRKAFRRFPRPSSPPDAKTFPVCPWSLRHANQHVVNAGYPAQTPHPPACKAPIRFVHSGLCSLDESQTITPLRRTPTLERASIPHNDALWHTQIILPMTRDHHTPSIAPRLRALRLLMCPPGHHLGKSHDIRLSESDEWPRHLPVAIRCAVAPPAPLPSAGSPMIQKPSPASSRPRPIGTIC